MARCPPESVFVTSLFRHYIARDQLGRREVTFSRCIEKLVSKRRMRVRRPLFTGSCEFKQRLLHLYRIISFLTVFDF